MSRLFRNSIHGLSRVIGITGGIASGKSHAREHLITLGAIAVDCDSLAHKAYAVGTPCYSALREAFSDDIIGTDGNIDRRRLGARVFGSPADLGRLNGIVWPAVEGLVHAELEKLVASASVCAHESDAPLIAVVEAALLIEAGWHERCDELWVVHVSKEEAVRRLHERNGLSEAEALARIGSQMSVEKRLEHATVAIDASGPKTATKAALDAAWAALLERVRADRAPPSASAAGTGATR